MTRTEHHEQIRNGNLAGRVVSVKECTSDALYYAWLPTWEGPARPEYTAALADLNDRIRLNP